MLSLRRWKLYHFRKNVLAVLQRVSDGTIHFAKNLKHTNTSVFEKKDIKEDGMSMERRMYKARQFPRKRCQHPTHSNSSAVCFD